MRRSGAACHRWYTDRQPGKRAVSMGGRHPHTTPMDTITDTPPGDRTAAVPTNPDTKPGSSSPSLFPRVQFMLKTFPAAPEQVSIPAATLPSRSR
jgi:hypothetical protein